MIRWFDESMNQQINLLAEATMDTAKLETNQKVERWSVFTLSVWALGAAVAGYYGLFTKLPFFGIAPLVVAGIAIPVMVYYLNENFRAYIQSIDLKHLTIFHLWRIPAGFAFLYYGSQNLLPETFVRNAGYGDIIVGFLVPLILMWKGGGVKYLTFHIFGLLDFVVAVGTGLSFTVARVPLMDNIATFPIVLIPVFGVCVTGALSIMTLDILLRKRSVARETGAVSNSYA